MQAADTRTQQAEARAREQIEQARAEARSLVQAAEAARDRATAGAEQRREEAQQAGQRATAAEARAEDARAETSRVREDAAREAGQLRQDAAQARAEGLRLAGQARADGPAPGNATSSAPPWRPGPRPWKQRPPTCAAGPSAPSGSLTGYAATTGSTTARTVPGPAGPGGAAEANSDQPVRVAGRRGRAAAAIRARSARPGRPGGRRRAVAGVAGRPGHAPQIRRPGVLARAGPLRLLARRDPSTGHGKFRAGSRAGAGTGAPASRIVTAHVYAYQLHHGVIPAHLAGQVVIRHRCDETSCQNREDLLTGTQPDNVGDYRARRGREDGPLADPAAPAAGPSRSGTRSWPPGATAPAPRKPCSGPSPRASPHAKNASSEKGNAVRTKHPSPTRPPARCCRARWPARAARPGRAPSGRTASPPRPGMLPAAPGPGSGPARRFAVTHPQGPGLAAAGGAM